MAPSRGEIADAEIEALADRLSRTRVLSTMDVIMREPLGSDPMGVAGCFGHIFRKTQIIEAAQASGGPERLELCVSDRV